MWNVYLIGQQINWFAHPVRQNEIIALHNVIYQVETEKCPSLASLKTLKLWNGNQVSWNVFHILYKAFDYWASNILKLCLKVWMRLKRRKKSWNKAGRCIFKLNEILRGLTKRLTFCKYMCKQDYFFRKDKYLIMKSTFVVCCKNSINEKDKLD